MPPAHDPNSKTENEILDFIEGDKSKQPDPKAGDGGGEGESGNEDEGEGEAGDDTGEADAGEEDAAPGDEGGDKGGKGTGGSDKQGDKGAKGDKSKEGKPIIDKKTGKPVAQAGADRRFYEDAMHYRGEAQRLTTALNEVTTKYTALNDAWGKINAQGLAPDEFSQVAELGAMWKKDPVAAIAEIITRAKTEGIDLSRLNLQSVDTNAIKQLIQREVGSRLDPIDQDRQTRERDAKATSDAKLELDTFLDRNPDAETHLPAITNLMVKVPDMTLREAWLEVRDYAIRNGIDLSKPPGAESPRREGQTRKPIPSGGRGVENGSGGRQPSQQNKGGSAPVGTSLDDIIVSAMREAGINYSR